MLLFERRIAFRLALAWTIFALPLLLLSGCDNKTADSYLQSANEYMADNKPQAAVIELKNSLRKNPDLAAARALLGQAHFQLGDYEAALKELETANELGLDDQKTSLTILRAKNMSGRYAKVISELEGGALLSPELEVELGNAYFLAEDVGKAKSAYQQGAHLVDGLVGLAAVARLEGDLAAAKTYLDQAVAKDPLHRRAWLNKAEVELALADSAAALDSFEHAGRLPGGEVASQIGMARAYLHQDDVDAAEEIIDSILEKSTRQLSAQYLKGLIGFRRGDMLAAENALQVVQQYAPNDPATLNLMGAVKYELRQFSQAESYLRRYLAVDPSNISARKLLAATYNSQNDPKKAVAVLKPASHSSTDPQLWAMLGAAELAAGDASAATSSLQQAVLLAPSMGVFRNQLALSFLSSGESEEAAAVLEDAVKLDGDQFENEYLRVMLLIRDKKFDEAAAEVEQLIASRPDSPVGHNLKGAIAVALENEAGAEQSFEDALAVQPGFIPAITSLANLDEQRGDAAAARRRYEEALDANPYSEPLLLGFANLLSRQGDRASALGVLEKAVGANPESVPARIGLIRLLLLAGQNERATEAANSALAVADDVPDLLLLKAEADLRNADLPAARSTATRLQVLLDKAEPNVNLFTATGTLQMKVGNYGLARSNFEAAAALGDPVPPGALVGLAQLDLNDGNVVLAQQRLDELNALGLGGESIDLLQGDIWVAGEKLELATTLFARMASGGSRQGVSRVSMLAAQEEDYQKAESVLKDWLDSHPDDRAMQMLLANLYMQEERTDDARALYESMLPTEDPVALNNLAWLYLGRDNDRAIEMAQQAKAVAPGNADITDTLGWVLVQSGSVNEGLAFLKNAVYTRPENAGFHYHLGVAYKDAGQLVDARDSLLRAVELGDFDELDEARTMLINLERRGADQ
jgi:putative PEP-CTERM system TPR-repeat lipoprotein